MAKAGAESGGAEQGSGPGLVVAVLICIGIGGISGAGFGYFASLPAAPQPAAVEAEAAAKPSIPPEEIVGRFPHDAIELAVEPVIATIGPDFKTNVRLEFSIIVASGTPDEGPLKSEIREDVIAYLKGLTLSDLEGGRSFQLLRDELDDRARNRGRGVVLGMLISGLVVQ